MNPNDLTKLGLMRKLSTGEYVFTIKGQRMYANNPNWKPTQPPKQSMSKDQLNTWLRDNMGADGLTWTDEKTDRERN